MLIGSSAISDTLAETLSTRARGTHLGKSSKVDILDIGMNKIQSVVTGAGGLLDLWDLHGFSIFNRFHKIADNLGVQRLLHLSHSSLG